MMNNNIRLLLLWGLVALSGFAHAQTGVQPLAYQLFMEKVSAGNLEYAAEKLNVSISDAEAVAANVNNDPQLGFEYFNNEQAKKRMGYGGAVSISQTLTFGKRTAAVRLAKSESALSRFLLADYLRNLRASATVAYLQALKEDQLYQVKQNAYRNMKELAKADSIRFSLGKIMQIDATQSKLEASVMNNELIQSEADIKNSFASLSIMMGEKNPSVMFRPDGSPKVEKRSFNLSELLKNATQGRADFLAARQEIDRANKELTLAHRERNMDVDVSLGVSHNARVENDEAPAPPFTGVTLGFAVPIRLSNLNKGALMAAKHRVEQASTQYEQTSLQLQNEITQAFNQYESLSKQVELFENGMLEEAAQVLKGKTYSYNRGEVSLLEVLNAQRTFDDVQALYYETKFNYASALVELEKCAGIWDF